MGLKGKKQDKEGPAFADSTLSAQGCLKHGGNDPGPPWLPVRHLQVILGVEGGSRCVAEKVPLESTWDTKAGAWDYQDRWIIFSRP